MTHPSTIENPTTREAVQEGADLVTGPAHRLDDAATDIELAQAALFSVPIDDPCSVALDKVVSAIQQWRIIRLEVQIARRVARSGDPGLVADEEKRQAEISV